MHSCHISHAQFQAMVAMAACIQVRAPPVTSIASPRAAFAASRCARAAPVSRKPCSMSAASRRAAVAAPALAPLAVSSSPSAMACQRTAQLEACMVYAPSSAWSAKRMSRALGCAYSQTHGLPCPRQRPAAVLLELLAGRKTLTRTAYSTCCACCFQSTHQLPQLFIKASASKRRQTCFEEKSALRTLPRHGPHGVRLHLKAQGSPETTRVPLVLAHGHPVSSRRLAVPKKPHPLHTCGASCCSSARSAAAGPASSRCCCTTTRIAHQRQLRGSQSAASPAGSCASPASALAGMPAYGQLVCLVCRNWPQFLLQLPLHGIGLLACM